MIKVNENKILKMVQDKQLEELNDYIKSEITLQLNTNKTDKQRVKKFISLSNKFKKSKKIYNPSLKGAFIDNGYMHICDSYRLISFKDLTINCAMIKSDVKKIDTISLYKTQDNLKELKLNILDIELKYKDYKSATKNTKEYKEVYKILDAENNVILACNINYLKDMIDLFDMSKTIVSYSNSTSPLYFFSENGDKGFVLPIRLPK